MTGYSYVGFGLSLVSDLELPEFLPASAATDPDIRIRLDQGLEALWSAVQRPEGEFLPAPGGGFFMRVPEVGVYHVAGGREIRIAVEPAADPGLLRLVTVGSAMGLALHQRGILVLHGATVIRGGAARIFVGDSGAGKSTLAAHLGRAGCSVFGDDTMAVWRGQGDHPGRWLWQGSRLFKLWEDSLAAMGVGVDGLARLANRTDKYYVQNAGPEGAGGESFSRGAPLAEIIVLETNEGPLGIEPLQGLQALQAIAAHTYRPEYVPLLGREAEHFRQCASLARDIPVVRLVRPWGVDRIDETIELLLKRWPTRAAAKGAVS